MGLPVSALTPIDTLQDTDLFVIARPGFRSLKATRLQLSMYTSTIDLVARGATFGPNNSLVSSSSLTWNGFSVGFSTLTLSGTTAITTATGLNLANITAPTITNPSAVTVTNASTFAISGAPTAGGSVSITNAYSLWVQAGRARFDGNVLLNTSLTVIPVQTIASASGATFDGISVQPSSITATITGNTNITTSTGFNLCTITRPIYAASSALTITNAATLTITDNPFGGGTGPVTITNAYALWVQNGNVRLPNLIIGQALPASLTTVSITAANPSGVIGAISNTNTASSVLGIAMTNNNNGSSTMGLAYGYYAKNQITSTGGITAANGYYSTFGSSAAGVLATVAHFYADSPAFSSGGTATTVYGLFVNTQKSGSVTTAYGIYCAGTSDISFIAGKLGVATNNPTSIFSVGSTSQFQVNTTGAIASYNGVGTTAWGMPAVYGYGRSNAAIAAVASVTSYTVGAADGTFEVSANVNVTTATNHNFTVTVTYHDETNASRTLTLNFAQVAGTIATGITNTTGAGPYMGIPMHIRCKSATAITIATTGTFTTVTYNVEGIIKQVA